MNRPGPLTSALAEVSGWGPFFVVETHPPAAGPMPPWRPMRELLDDPEVLSARVEAVRAYLAAGTERPPNRVPARVAASVTHLGLVARLISPALGCMVHSGSLPALDLACLWWQPESGSAFPLSVGHRLGGTPEELLAGPVSDLVRALSVFSVSERVLWGNVASAINGAATMIGIARPDLAAETAVRATTLLDLPPLRHTSTRRPDGRFQRRSCCLIYQASSADRSAALCGDCILAAG